MTSSSEQFGATTLGGVAEGEDGYTTGYVPLPPAPPVGYEFTPPRTQGGDESSTAAVAKDQATDVAGSAADAAQHVAGVTKEQVGQVTAETGRQLRQLVGQAQSELTAQAQAQQEKLAGGLHAVGDQLKAMADNSTDPGVATDLAHQAADRAHQFAGWLDRRDPGSVLNEVRAYARRRPGTFLAIALGAGLVAGRLARGLAADPDEMSTDSDSSTLHQGSLSATGPARLVPSTSGVAPTAAPVLGYRKPADQFDGTYSTESDLYGTGQVPDWTGKPGSDVLGDPR